MEMWELVAREQIRDTLARYNWSGDAGRLEGLAETFCADGVLEIRGFEPLRGRSEIVAFLGGVTRNVAVDVDVKPVVRHNVANVLFTGLTPEHGARLVLLHRRYPYRLGPFRPLPRHLGTRR